MLIATGALRTPQLQQPLHGSRLPDQAAGPAPAAPGYAASCLTLHDVIRYKMQWDPRRYAPLIKRLQAASESFYTCSPLAICSSWANDTAASATLFGLLSTKINFIHSEAEGGRESRNEFFPSPKGLFRKMVPCSSSQNSYMTRNPPPF